MNYWARLRKDRPSNWATGLAVVAALAAVLAILGLAVPGAQAESRANPLYWVILLPLAWWGSGVAAFEPRPVRLLAVVTYAAPIVAITCLIIAIAQDRGWLIWLAAVVISIAAAIGSRRAYSRSLLKLEGASR
jgi:hypothetical protein